MRPVGRLLWCAIAMLDASTASAQYDAIRQGSLRLIRHQQEAGGLGYNQMTSVSCSNGAAAVAFRGLVGPIQFDAYIRHYDTWGRPLHDPILVDPQYGDNPLGLDCIRHGDRTCVYWHDQTDLSLWLKMYSSDGQPRTETVRANPTLHEFRATRMTMNDNRILLFILGRLSESGPERPFIRVLDLEGQPLSSLIQVSSSSQLVGSLSVTLDDMGDALLAFHQRPVNEAWRCMGISLRHDLTLSAPFLLAMPPSEGPSLDYHCAGSCFLTYSVTNDAAMMQRLDIEGAPLSAPVRLSSYYFSSAQMLADERLLSRSMGRNEVYARFWSSDWQPRTPEFDFTRDTAPPYHDFADVVRCPAYDESGTAWIVWSAFGAGENTYLTTLHPYQPADMNLDNRVDNFDIDAFVLALSDPAAYAAQYDMPLDVVRFYGDCNGDGAFNNFDIDAFVECLNNGGCP